MFASAAAQLELLWKAGRTTSAEAIDLPSRQACKPGKIANCDQLKALIVVLKAIKTFLHGCARPGPQIWTGHDNG